MPSPSPAIRDAMEVISRYCLFSENGEVLREHFVKMNGIIEKELVRKRKQMILDVYYLFYYLYSSTLIYGCKEISYR